MLTLLSILIFLLPSVAFGATYTADSCSYADVSAKYAASVSAGDTLSVPAGACTWTSYMTIDKTVTIAGAGTDASTGTRITDNCTSSTAGLFSVSMGADERFTLHGIRVLSGASQYVGSSGVVNITGAAQNYMKFHVYDCTFVGMKRSTIHADDPYGLINGNQFLNTSTTSVFIEGDRDTAFTRTVELGGQWAVFIEDNLFDNATPSSAYLELWDGPRVVVRHNTANNAWVSMHGYEDVAANYRGPVSTEYYENTGDCDGSCYAAIKWRGGTGVIYNNTWTETGGQWSSGPDHGISVLYYGLYSGVDATCGGGGQSWRNRCVTYPCKDMPGYVGTQLTPFYVWDNTTPATFFNQNTGASSTDSDGYDCATTPKAYNTPASCTSYTETQTCFIQENREYYLAAPAGGYTPYTYPHPLRGASATHNLGTFSGSGSFQ